MKTGIKIALLFLLFTSTAFSQQIKKGFPNIIYIYADDMGYGELGCYGQQKMKTPNLDRMAAEGIRFLQHYSSAPVCAPSRAMLMTGKHAGHSYIRGNYELGGFADSAEGMKAANWCGGDRTHSRVIERFCRRAEHVYIETYLRRVA